MTLKTGLGVFVVFMIGLSLGYIGGSSSKEYSLTRAQSLYIPNTETENLPNQSESGLVNNEHLRAVNEVSVDRSDSYEDEIISIFEQTQQIADVAVRLDRMTQLYIQYAEINPEAALDHALANGAAARSPITDQWLHSIFARLAEQDPDRAIQKAKTFRLGIRAISAILENAKSSNKKDILRKLRIDTSSMPLAADELIRIIDNPEIVYRESKFTNARSFSISGKKGAAAITWAIQDPVSAMNALSIEKIEKRDEVSFRTLVSQIMNNWGLVNLEQALDWLETQHPSEHRTKLLASTLSGMVSSSPQEAFDIIASVPDRGDQLTVTRTVISRWTTLDPKAVLDWYGAASFADRERTFFPIARAYIQVNPISALDWLTSLPAESQNNVFPRLIGSIARELPEAAAQHFSDMPESKYKQETAVSILSSWARIDSDAARDWMLRLDLKTQSRLADTYFLALPMGSRVHDELMKIEDKPYFDKVALRALPLIKDISQMKSVHQSMSDPESKKSAALGIYLSLLNVDADGAELFRQQFGIEVSSSEGT